MRRRSIYLTAVLGLATVIAIFLIANSLDFEEAADDYGEALAQTAFVGVIVLLWLAVSVPSMIVIARDWRQSRRRS